MLQHQPSRTAEYMAMFRASEHAKGAGRRIFSDPLAVALLPDSLRLPAKLFALRPVAAMLDRYIDLRSPGARTSGIARTRLIDDWIEQSGGEVDQLVLLGAGFDTRAWRLKSLDAVRIYEVDHPDTASVKRRRRIAGADLNKVSFVAVDFEIDDSTRGCAKRASMQRAGRSWSGKALAITHRGRGISRDALGGPARERQPVHLHLCP